MTIQDWGAIGEVVGAAAVVASLIYLAIQIRQNTRRISHSIENAKLAAFERNIESANRLREMFILNEGISDLFLRGIKRLDQLNGNDRYRFDLLLRNIFAAFQGAYLREQALGGDPLGFEGTARMIDSIISNPGVREWLSESELDWRPEFRDFIEERAAAVARQSGCEK